MFSVGSAASLAACLGKPGLTDTMNLTIGIFLAIALAYLIFKCINNLFIYPFYTSPLRHLPGPKDNTFLMGQATKFLQVDWMPNLFMKWSRQWLDAPFILYTNFGNSETLLVNDISAYNEILLDKSNCFVKPSFARAFIHEVIGDGLPFIEHGPHKKRHNLMERFFSPRRLQHSAEMIQQKSRQLCDNLANMIGNKPGVIDIETPVWEAVFDIIGFETFGYDLNNLGSDTSPLWSAISSTMLLSTRNHIVNYINSVIPIRRFLPLAEVQQFLENKTTSRNFIRDRLNERRVAKQKQQDDADSVDTPDHQDCLQGFINHCDESWGENEIIEYTLNLLVLGHDTTACSMTWALYELSLHQDVQERLRSEIRSNDATNIDGRKYLSAFINEVLRVHCAVPMAPRQATRDITVAGTVIPKGTVLQLSPAVINLHPKVWGPNATEFDPSRWENRKGVERTPASLETFHRGPRVCIGRNLTLTEMKYMITEIVSRFQIESVSDGPIEIASPAFTLRPKHKLQVRLCEL